MRATLVLAFVLAASACDGGGHAASVYALLAPGELDAASAPAGWSAPGLLRAAVAPSGLLDPPFAGDCPRVTAGELETTVEGGCTDAAGRTWHGRATLPSRSQGGLAGGAIVYEGFGVEGPSECRASGGRARVLHDGVVVTRGSMLDGELAFDIDVVSTTTGVLPDCAQSEAGVQLAVEYAGVRTLAPSGRETWWGSGIVASSERGRFDVRTEAEVIDDDVCASEGISGSTIVSGANEAVITYDGAVDCDPDGTVTWALDGQPLGEVRGVFCAASAGRPAPAVVVLGSVAPAALWLARRRRVSRRAR